MSDAATILIIDDDADYVRAIAHLLSCEGYQVSSAADGRQGIAEARRLQPDLILLDVMMTERTEGFFTLDVIRRDRALRDVAVIVISSIYTEVPIFKVHPDAGWLPADAFLPKPMDAGALLDEVARVLVATRERRFARSVAS